MSQLPPVQMSFHSDCLEINVLANVCPQLSGPCFSSKYLQTNCFSEIFNPVNFLVSFEPGHLALGVMPDFFFKSFNK